MKEFVVVGVMVDCWPNLHRNGARRRSRIADCGLRIADLLIPRNLLLSQRLLQETGRLLSIRNPQSAIRNPQSAIYCVAPTGATAMSTIGVFTVSVLTRVARPDGRYIE